MMLVMLMVLLLLSLLLSCVILCCFSDIFCFFSFFLSFFLGVKHFIHWLKTTILFVVMKYIEIYIIDILIQYQVTVIQRQRQATRECTHDMHIEWEGGTERDRERRKKRTFVSLNVGWKVCGSRLKNFTCFGKLICATIPKLLSIYMEFVLFVSRLNQHFYKKLVYIREASLTHSLSLSLTLITKILSHRHNFPIKMSR